MVIAHKQKSNAAIVKASAATGTMARPAVSESNQFVCAPEASGAVLLTPQQLAAKLAVPTSWIREKCRQRARVRDDDPLPMVSLGKYRRFRWSDVEAWLQRQSEQR